MQRPSLATWPTDGGKGERLQLLMLTWGPFGRRCISLRSMESWLWCLRIKILRPAPPRQGFFERDQLEAVKAALPTDLALVMTIAFLYGWRVPSEVLTLTKAQVR